MSTEQEQRQAVVAETLTWLGTPYHHQGRLKGVGVDCAQILIAVYAAVKLINEFDTGYYPCDWMTHRSEERYLGFVSQYAHRVDSPQPGDIVLYRFGRCVAHGGIVVAWPTIVHAFAPERKVVLGDGERGPFARHLHGFYSLWGAA
jgi:cell wall-associated NlpC family hydrolase